jgi:hypothetical protein
MGGDMEAGTEIVRDLPLGQPARLNLDADLINVTAAPVAGEGVPRMRLELPEGMSDARVNVDEREGTVFVSIETEDALRRILRNRWKITCRLDLPHGVEATMRTDAGQIELRGLSGSFDLRTNAGQVVLRAASGRVTIRSDAGKIDCEAFRGSIDAATSAGAIMLEALALDPGTHSLRADVGKIDVRLATDAAVRVETHTSIGRTRNSFGSGKADAPALLRVQTEVGAITVQPWDLAGASAARLGAGLDESARQQEIMRILEQVANHELTAEEANRRIAALR